MGILIGERMFNPTRQTLRPQFQLEEELESWAKEHQCWWSEEEIRQESDAQKMYSKGSESVVYIDKERKNVMLLMQTSTIARCRSLANHI